MNSICSDQQLSELYKSIRCPTLFRWAEQDQHFPVVQATQLHQAISGSMLEIVPGGTHWMPLTNAKLLAESTEAFDGFRQATTFLRIRRHVRGNCFFPF